MIKDKAEYRFYLEEDRKALGIKRKRPRLYGDEIWKFQRLLRRAEYLISKGATRNPWYIWTRLRMRRLAFKLNFDFAPFNFGPGLRIAHRGPIIILDKVRIGAYCEIHSMVNIGSTKGTGRGAVIGDHCYIGPGVCIIGPVTIADHVVIGAGSVVTKDIPEPGSVVGGVPAKLIKKIPYPRQGPVGV